MLNGFKRYLHGFLPNRKTRLILYLREKLIISTLVRRVAQPQATDARLSPAGLVTTTLMVSPTASSTSSASTVMLATAVVTIPVTIEAGIITMRVPIDNVRRMMMVIVVLLSSTRSSSCGGRRCRHRGRRRRVMQLLLAAVQLVAAAVADEQCGRRVRQGGTLNH